MKTVKSYPLLQAAILLSLVTFGLTSCKSKEDEALERAQSRPKPGFVRLFNLAGCDMKLVDRGMPLVTARADRPASGFASIRPGQLKVSANGACGNIPATIEVASQGAGTLVIGPGGKNVTWIGDEVRMPTVDTNFRVVALDADGKQTVGPDFKLSAAGTSAAFGSSKPTALLAPGSWTCDLQGLDEPVPVNIAEQHSYTLFLVQQKNGKWKGTVADNTPMLKPVIAGASPS